VGSTFAINATVRSLDMSISGELSFSNNHILFFAIYWLDKKKMIHFCIQGFLCAFPSRGTRQMGNANESKGPTPSCCTCACWNAWAEWSCSSLPYMSATVSKGKQLLCSKRNWRLGDESSCCVSSHEETNKILFLAIYTFKMVFLFGTFAHIRFGLCFNLLVVIISFMGFQLLYY
jgi:hypothetical protein